MNQTWLDQLISPGSGSELIGSASATTPANSVQFLERGDLAVVRIEGSDAASFLQAQTCNDHAEVTANTAQLNGYCSPKGRLLALPIVAAGAGENTFYWLLSRDLVETVVKRLTMFVLRSDVSIQVEEDWVVVGLAAKTDQLDESLEHWFGEAGAAELSSWSKKEHLAIKARSVAGFSRSLLFGPAETIKTSLMECFEALPQGLDDPLWSDRASWYLGDIQAGVPSIVAKTQDAFVPQMVNLEQVDGLSFTKGCYPGQEIVARMQYLGKLKRTMVRFSSTEPAVAFAGDKLKAGDDENAGEVVNSVVVDGGMECLAVIKTSADLATFSFNGAALSAQDLPYT